MGHSNYQEEIQAYYLAQIKKFTLNFRTMFLLYIQESIDGEVLKTKTMSKI